LEKKRSEKIVRFRGDRLYDFSRAILFLFSLTSLKRFLFSYENGPPMSKLIVLVLLAAFLIPAVVLADPSGSSCSCGVANTTGRVTGWGPGMMGSGINGAGPGTCSSGNGTTCDYGNYAPQGANGNGYANGNGDYRGMMGGYGATPGAGNGGMMYGQPAIAGAGMYGWAAGIFFLVIVLIIIWIIVGILLILTLYRKLSAK
jgi:hypothetical protein